METIGFNDMGLKKDLLQMIDEKGFVSPTPIQIMAIPLALAGHDVMGQAQTGTGKTASFGVPILNKIKPGKGLQALILCPTRELAIQVKDEIAFLGRRLRVHVLAIYGGQAIELQFRGLEKNPEIVVATPGRMLDHMGRMTIDLSRLDFVVLDEADEMLDMGFLPDIEKIMQKCPPARQTSLFSATLGEKIQQLGQKFMKDPRMVSIETPERTVAEIRHSFYEVNPRYKLETLCRIIDEKQPASCLIFCRTKRCVGQLANFLEQYGYHADALHGDMSQRERDQVMKRFRSGHIGILVATDLAARGLDIDLVSHVVNYDLPEDPDVFIHRTGRTGRAGRSGESISLVETIQFRQFRLIERYIGKRIHREELSDQQTKKGRQDFLHHRAVQAVKNPAAAYEALAKELLNEYEAVKLVASFLRLLDDQIPELEIVHSERKSKKHIKLDGMKKTAKYRTSALQMTDSVIVEQPMGKNNGFDAQKIADYIVAHSSLTSQHIGEIEVHPSSCYIEVPMEKVDEVYQVFYNIERRRRNNNYYHHQRGS